MPWDGFIGSDAVHPPEVEFPLGCDPCLNNRGLHTWGYHLICRVYAVLNHNRGAWVGVRQLTAMTYDITAEQFYPVQQAIHYLRRFHGCTIRMERGPRGRGACSYLIEEGIDEPAQIKQRRVHEGLQREGAA